jgi:hypothetical protein
MQKVFNIFMDFHILTMLKDIFEKWPLSVENNGVGGS